MSSQTILEKLQLTCEKNLLIQGLPSSIEKQFIKLTFSKNVTPLLKKRKIDFALVFAVNQKQLKEILDEVIPILQPDSKFWIAYPKISSKISSDLCRDDKWEFISDKGYEAVRMIALDNLWTAARFKLPDVTSKNNVGFSAGNPSPGINYVDRTVELPVDLDELMHNNRDALTFFETLSFTNKREYVEWVLSAKKQETRETRIQSTIEKLAAGKKNRSQK